MAINIIDNHLYHPYAFVTRPYTDLIVVHHTEGKSMSVEDINDMHINSNGWNGIGYHLYVRKDGKVYQGRPLDVIGAHTYGHNENSVGVCCEGNFNEESMSQTQLETLLEILCYVDKVYPRCAIKRHKDLYNTDCPGDNFPWETVKNFRGEKMSYETFKEYMKRYLSEESNKEPSNFATYWEIAFDKGICDGMRPRCPATREEVVQMLGRCDLL